MTRIVIIAFATMVGTRTVGKEDHDSKNNRNADNRTSKTYEEIMGIKKSSGGDESMMQTDQGGGMEALSNRLIGFRKWCTEEANMVIHPAMCIVNGEATDGTKNAPKYAIGPPPGSQPVSASSAQGRVGMVDGVEDIALYERTMGCQIWTTKEIKKDEVILTCPKSAMITPDLVASSDAGRAILACCSKVDSAAGNAMGSNFWDAFENTTVCESKFAQKMARSTGTQLLVNILRDRTKAEKAFKKSMSASLDEAEPSNNDNGDIVREKAAKGVISTRAPFLAFLIHQRFAPQVRPPVAEEMNSDLERVIKEDGDTNALTAALRVQSLEGTPFTFAPYARTLPSSVSLPICWKRNELALLSGCITGVAPLQEVAATTMQLASEFIALLNAGILKRFSAIFPPGTITWDRWVWAASVFTSRLLPSSCYLNSGEEKAALHTPSTEAGGIMQSPPDIWDELGVMIPFLDMINHEVEAQSVTWQQNLPIVSDTLQPGSEITPHPPRAIVSKRVKKGQQIYSRYGGDELCNQEMILLYGFAQMLNSADVARLGWGLMDAIGHAPAPADYTPLVSDSEEDSPFLVFESNDGTAINEWWSDERLSLLETEAFPAVENSFMSSLKMGKKMTGSARSDGLYDPILLTVSLVSTMPVPELTQLAARNKSENGRVSLLVTKRHQRVLRCYLLFIFTRKLEKLLENLRSGLKDHYGSLNLWTKASEGGIRYKGNETESDDPHVGWQASPSIGCTLLAST